MNKGYEDRYREIFGDLLIRARHVTTERDYDDAVDFTILEASPRRASCRRQQSSDRTLGL